MTTLRVEEAPLRTATPRVPGLGALVPAQGRTGRRPHLSVGRDAAWLRTWTTVLGMAFLAGRPLPAPPPAVRAAALYQPRRTDRLTESLAERFAAERGAALRGCYSPGTLARALTGTARRLLADRPVPPYAGQVWVIPQLRWAYEAARVGWESGFARPDDLAPPLDFAITGLPDWPGILAGQRLELLARHPAALTVPANRALAATALYGADGKPAFCQALAADLTLIFPAAYLGSLRVAPQKDAAYRTDNPVCSDYHPKPEILAEAMRLMDVPSDWLIAAFRPQATG